MRLLIINLDKSIFRVGSRSLADLKDYSRVFEKLFVIVWTLKKEKPIVFEDKLFIYSTNSLSKIFYIFDTFKIFRRFLKKEGIDLISSQDPFETGLSAWLISKISKIPLHLQAHTDFLSSYFVQHSMLNRLRVLIAKFLIPRAVGIRVVSKRIRDSILFKLSKSNSNSSTIGVGLPKIDILPIFVDVEKIRNAPIKIDLHQKYPQFDFIILMASRLTKEKNVGLALQALSDASIQMYANDTNVGLIIVGDGPERKNLKSQISNLKSNDNMIIEDWTNDLNSYYKTCDLFLLTSDYEGYGMTLIEAAAAGCKIISSDVGIADEILEKENIFKPGDKEGLRNKINMAIRRQIKLPKLIQSQTREKYLEEYKKVWE